MNCLLLAATLCLFVVFATALTGCNNDGCTTQLQAYIDVAASGEMDRICSAARTVIDCLGSSCRLADTFITLLKHPVCGPFLQTGPRMVASATVIGSRTVSSRIPGSGSGRVVISVSSLLMTLVFTKIFV
ncbi:uncharacterized protein LOC124129369 isoform X1 [Haliotis rufescens]|uniref:uncharacterized protein LOC124129369 isoform X1 n=1 Tax=Haliotis rufescens TaxID=6454 RepID=UPI00201F7A9A|nr:uncharacterized protein LOC124129369 isoform X1 [Haliotis rufescens]